EGLCPHSRSMDDASQMEEERRLVYVGMTRAMRGLYLVYAFHRTVYGNTTGNQPSRFLQNIPPELTERPFGRTPMPPAAAGMGSVRQRAVPAGRAAPSYVVAGPRQAE